MLARQEEVGRCVGKEALEDLQKDAFQDESYMPDES